MVRKRFFNLVVLAAAVVRRRCRKRFGHLYRRRWSHWERLSCFEADGRLYYSPRHGDAHGVPHRLLCSAATLGQAPRRVKPHEHRTVACRHGLHRLPVTSRPRKRVRGANGKALLLNAAAAGLAVAAARLVLQVRRRHVEATRGERLPHRDALRRRHFL